MSAKSALLRGRATEPAAPVPCMREVLRSLTRQRHINARTVNLWLVVAIVIVLFCVNEARKGEMRAIPYSALVLLAVIGSLGGIWLVLEWISPD